MVFNFAFIIGVYKIFFYVFSIKSSFYFWFLLIHHFQLLALFPVHFQSHSFLVNFPIRNKIFRCVQSPQYWCFQLPDDVQDPQSQVLPFPCCLDTSCCYQPRILFKFLKFFQVDTKLYLFHMSIFSSYLFYFDEKKHSVSSFF